MTTTPTPPGLVPPPVPNRVLDDPDDWEYFGEGANNVLYRYVGADTFFVRPSLLHFCSPSPTSNLCVETISPASSKALTRIAYDPKAPQSSARALWPIDG